MAQITRTLVKQYLRFSHTAQDDVLDMLIAGCEDWVERYCGITFVAKNYNEYVNGGVFGLRLTNRPISAVSRVDDNELGVTEDSDNYILRHDAVYRDDEDRWSPGTSRYRIWYSGGMSTIEPGLKVALAQLIARAYENRENKGQQAAAGYGTNWLKLMEAQSDIRTYLQPYRRGGAFLG